MNPKYHDKIAALDSQTYHITQEAGTEMPFTGTYNDFYQKGIYVDIVSGEPLFASSKKYNAGCGWPSFTEPIVKDNITYHQDHAHGMVRTEVRSADGQTHLGHVFSDGPAEQGGLRYCINSASLKFIPYEAMAEAGYQAYLDLVE